MFNHGHRFENFLIELSQHEVPCSRVPDLFFPEDIPDRDLREEATITAIALCKTCPFRLQCFEYATSEGIGYGIWGGTLPHQR